ncbi:MULTISPECIES: amidohydrolase [Rhodococcus]|uniref:amidohydrolase n=1 Tax=Rhodococcus TaxID=1827 RepID=UPI000573222C|nr:MULTISPECIES: amidohydrolase family protein [unclassified Rhodococcus (in: high G+C Gram-positive bacteria)]KHJ71498.1 amidohydrolase [Rhodococcus sp. Chr-9]
MSPAPHTQLLVGGRIYSASAPDATAMAVTDGTVVWVGQDRPGRALHPDAEIVDLHGAFVAPGFVDTHVHTTSHGLALTGLDLTDAVDRDDALRRVRAHADAHDDAVIWGHGWDETRWPDPTPPTTADLDAAAPARLVYLGRIDAHSAAASSALRAVAEPLDELAGFDPQQPLTAAAHHAVRGAARRGLTAAQRARARLAALDDFAAHGYVAVHECAGPDISGLDDFTELLGTDHPVQVRGYWGQAVRTGEEAAELLAETGADALGGDLFVDGSIGSHTAALARPYDDLPDCCGTRYLTEDELTAHVRACTSAGIQAGFHVIGDAATTAAVAAFEAVAAEVGGPVLAARGHRLEHVESLTVAQAEVLSRYGVIASMQPSFDALWGGADGMYAQRLGADRAAALNAFAPLAATGLALAFGSDAPVTAPRPWPMLRAAVHHRTEGSGISPRAAFAAATRGAWRAGGVRDGLAGTLDPGAPASYAIWEVGELVVSAPKDSVQRWSTDPRSRVAPLPDLAPGTADPVLVRSVHRGRVVYAR